jgi:hypothetical protein
VRPGTAGAGARDEAEPPGVPKGAGAGLSVFPRGHPANESKAAVTSDARLTTTVGENGIASQLTAPRLNPEASDLGPRLTGLGS